MRAYKFVKTKGLHGLFGLFLGVDIALEPNNSPDLLFISVATSFSVHFVFPKGSLDCPILNSDAQHLVFGFSSIRPVW